MRIGIDTGCWLNGRGYGRFTRELLHALCDAVGPEDRLLFFMDEPTAVEFDLRGEHVERVVTPLSETPSEAAATGGNRRIGDLWRLSRAVGRADLDVFFFPSVYSYFPVPVRLATVVTIHDAIAERFPELTLPSLRDRLFWKLKVGLALRQSRLVLTVSEYSADEISDVHGIPAEKLRVAGEAPSPEYRPPADRSEVTAAARRIGLPEGGRWFTYVGGFNPHKRLDVLIEAHARLLAEDPAEAPYLVLVGSRDSDRFHDNLAELEELIARRGTGDRVVWTGFLPDRDLRALHAGALALVLPSEAEGFGLPAVEAAACGTPVVATRRSPLPRLLDGGGIFVEPGDTGALAGALRTLARDEETRSRMARRAERRAGELSWDRSARSTLAALREAAA